MRLTLFYIWTDLHQNLNIRICSRNCKATFFQCTRIWAFKKSRLSNPNIHKNHAFRIQPLTKVRIFQQSKSFARKLSDDEHSHGAFLNPVFHEGVECGKWLTWVVMMQRPSQTYPTWSKRYDQSSFRELHVVGWWCFAFRKLLRATHFATQPTPPALSNTSIPSEEVVPVFRPPNLSARHLIVVNVPCVRERRNLLCGSCL